MSPIFWDTLSNLTHLRSLTLIGIAFPSIGTLRSLVSTHVEELRLIDIVFASNDVYRQDGLETRVQSLTCQGYNQPGQYGSIMTLCPTLAYTAHSIDITLYSRRHILQMQEQLDKGILRNITVLHMPREVDSMFKCVSGISRFD